MSEDARDFNDIETRAVIKFYFPLQSQAPKDIHDILTDRNISGTCTTVCHRQKLGGTV